MAVGDFFDANDMAELRTVAASAMGGSAIIRRLQETPTGRGTFTEGRVPVGTVPCHVWEERGDEIVAGARVVNVRTPTVSVPYDTNVIETDWLDIGNVTYEVTDVPRGITWKPELKLKTKVYNGEQKA